MLNNPSRLIRSGADPANHNIPDELGAKGPENTDFEANGDEIRKPLYHSVSENLHKLILNNNPCIYHLNKKINFTLH
jgi:hypothetical protein